MKTLLILIEILLDAFNNLQPAFPLNLCVITISSLSVNKNSRVVKWKKKGKGGKSKAKLKKRSFNYG